jgi:nitrite reductase/ring-hydroxylating ferredoxin subunit
MMALAKTETPRFPFGIPNCWYAVSYSDEIAPGDIKHLHYFDEELVLFRSEDGSIGLLDAYCDHLGAHLAKGGTVVGDSIRCPFHNWHWNSAGRCTKIPYASIIPPKARIRHYPVCEHSGLIWAWHQAQGAEPAWALPPVPQYGDPAWTDEWIRYEWTIATHPQEVYENGVDYPHFAIVHKFAAPTDPVSRYEGHVHVFGVETARNPDAGDDQGREPMQQRGDIIGLGVSYLRITGELDVVVLVTTTPVANDRTHIRLAVLGNKDYASAEIMAEKYEAYTETQAIALTDDFEIWENKKYRTDPRLCHQDGPILKFREWAKQFYS